MKYNFDLKVTLERVEPIGDSDDRKIVMYSSTGEGSDYDDAYADAIENVLKHHDNNKYGYDVADIDVDNSNEQYR